MKSDEKSACFFINKKFLMVKSFLLSIKLQLFIKSFSDEFCRRI
nr:MAG TPA: hypothetical protein [Caudoviricetes sp.]